MAIQYPSIRLEEQLNSTIIAAQAAIIEAVATVEWRIY